MRYPGAGAVKSISVTEFILHLLFNRKEAKKKPGIGNVIYQSACFWTIIQVY
jgi:hypothetical protein